MATLTIHGCRGGTAIDSLEMRVFGGNSSCYTFNTGDDLFFFDAGTGFLLAEQEYFDINPKRTHLLLSHMHHDHIEGLNISRLAFMEDANITVYSRLNAEAGFAQRHSQLVSPIPFELLKGLKEFRFANKPIEVGGVTMDTMLGNHPNFGSTGFRLEYDGKVVVLTTDMEFSYDLKGELPPIHKQAFSKFIKGADILLAEAQYSKEEYVDEIPYSVRGYGHSYTEEMVDLAGLSGVKHLILTHHSHKSTDRDLWAKELHASRYCFEKGYKMKVDLARQRKVYDI